MTKNNIKWNCKFSKKGIQTFKRNGRIKRQDLLACLEKIIQKEKDIKKELFEIKYRIKKLKKKLSL